MVLIEYGDVVKTHAQSSLTEAIVRCRGASPCGNREGERNPESKRKEGCLVVQWGVNKIIIVSVPKPPPDRPSCWTPKDVPPPGSVMLVNEPSNK